MSSAPPPASTGPLSHWRQLAASGRLGPSVSFRHGHRPFSAGDAANSVYFLCDGVLEILHEEEDGRSLLVKLLTAPTFFGAIEGLTSERVYLESVRSLGSVRVHVLTRSQFRSVLETENEASFECLRDLAHAFAKAARFERARLLDVENLLANLFLAYCELFGTQGPNGTRISVRRSQAELAESVGASERQVNRVLADWKNAQWVLKERGRYVVTDAPPLQRLAGPLQGSLVHRAP